MNSKELGRYINVLAPIGILYLLAITGFSRSVKNDAITKRGCACQRCGER